MQTISIGDVPSQILTSVLGGQQCRLRIITRRDMLFLDLYVSDTLIVAGALCKNGVPIVRDGYLGFSGDLLFVDTQGALDPSSPGLGMRYQLQYVTAAELAAP